MRKVKTNEWKRVLPCLILIVALLFAAVTAAPLGFQTAEAAEKEITLVAEVEGLVAGAADPEFTVTLKIENNTGTIGGLEIILTPLDDNVTVGDSDSCYVAGGTWSAANGFARVDDGKNIHMIGSDDTGITAATFTHGGYKFKYNGTPSGGIPFNIAFEAAADDFGDDIDVKYNGQLLTGDLSVTNFTASGRTLETTNTLSALTLTVGGTPIINGTGDEQTASAQVANADKAKVKISATRAGAASKIKVTEGDKTIVAEKTGDVADVSLGDLDVGEHTITVTVTSESGAEKTYTLKFTVAEAGATPVAKPNPTPTTTGGYTGAPIDFTPSGMPDLVKSGKVKLYKVSEDGTETEAGIDVFKPTNAGGYKVIARPTDGFCWDGGSTEDVPYEFTVGKAKLTATPGANGGLPTISGGTYTGPTNNIFDYKYYSDPDCTQEVNKDALEEGTTYYVKPVLKAGMEENFEFDAGTYTQQLANSGTTYTKPTTSTPTPTPTPTEEKKGIPWWVWLIVAAVLLILIIIVVILLMRRKKDDKDDGNGNRPYPPAFFMGGGTKNDSKTEKLEDRIHELEKEANEREVNRYREEAERAERKAEKADKKDTVVPPIVPFPTPASTTDTAAQERVKELEARMREIEKEAHEKELQHYKEAAERAEKKGDNKRVIRFSPPRPTVAAAPIAAVPAGPTAAEIAAQDRVRELETRMREMEKEAHEVERNAHDRELARYKEEVEQVRREAERVRQDMTYGQPRVGFPGAVGAMGAMGAMGVVGAVGVGGDTERVKELEARLREVEKEAHEKELQRYKEEAEAAKRAAEQRYYAKNPMPEPAYVPYRTNEEQASPYVMKLEEQLRRMEQEAHERELARYRSEAERARKEAEELARRSRRQEEELLRLHDLQAFEQRSREIVTARETAAGRTGNEMLERMEAQMRRQNSELQFLTDELERKLAAAMRK